MDIDIHPKAEPELTRIEAAGRYRDLARAARVIEHRARHLFQFGRPGAPLSANTRAGRTVTLTLHIITRGRVTLIVAVDDATGRGMLMAAGIRGFFAVQAEHRIYMKGVERAKQQVYDHGKI